MLDKRAAHPTGARSNGSPLDLQEHLQRLEAEGLLLRIEDQRSHIYEPAISKDQAQARFAGELMHRVFEGSARSLVLGALTAQRASERELEEIREILDRFEKKRKK